MTSPASSMNFYGVNQGFYEIEMGFYDIEVRVYELGGRVYEMAPSEGRMLLLRHRRRWRGGGPQQWRCTWNNSEYRERFGVSVEEVRSDLRDLVSRCLVRSTGQRRWVRYELA